MTYACAHCPEVLATVTDHLVHVSTVHIDRMDVPPALRLRRTFSCRRCARDLPPDALGCECGWLVPERQPQPEWCDVCGPGIPATVVRPATRQRGKHSGFERAVYCDDHARQLLGWGDTYHRIETGQ